MMPKRYVVANPRQIPQRGPGKAPILVRRTGGDAIEFYEGDVVTRKALGTAAFTHYLAGGFIVEAD
jgi:hypothetical protein